MQPITDSMAKYGMTATKYMSKMIREAVQCFGGTLVFDGADVFYEAVFSKREVRVGDTAEEARALFPEFAKFPGQSSVKWGRGTLIFHWRGKEIAPTQALFRESWQYIGDRKGGGGGPLTHQKESTLDSYESGIPSRKELFNDLWDKFPEGVKRDTSLSPEVAAARAKHVAQMEKIRENNANAILLAKAQAKVAARKEREAAQPAPPPTE